MQVLEIYDLDDYLKQVVAIILPPIPKERAPIADNPPANLDA